MEDSWLRVLAAPTQRRILFELHDDATEPLVLTGAFASQQTDRAGGRTQLYHCDIPSLEEAGLVTAEWNGANVTVRPGPEFARARPLLEAVKGCFDSAQPVN